MADNRSKEQRSYNMKQIRSKNTGPELLVRKFLFSHGYRYRLNVKKIVGKPDIVLKKYNTIIFINGCFWHGHKNCKNAKTPQNNGAFWINKIQTNSKRDKKNISTLKKDGWKICVIWECQLTKKNIDKTLSKLSSNLSHEN